jgi:predicted kinase
MVLGAGHDAILDTSYVKFGERDQARQLAARCGARFRCPDCGEIADNFPHPRAEARGA